MFNPHGKGDRENHQGGLGVSLSPLLDLRTIINAPGASKPPTVFLVLFLMTKKVHTAVSSSGQKTIELKSPALAGDLFF